MIQLDVRPRGADRVLAFLRRGVNLEPVVARELGAWAQDHLDGRLYGMENYAPAPANSTYVRTGNLGRNWGLARHGKTGVLDMLFDAYLEDHPDEGTPFLDWVEDGYDPDRLTAEFSPTGIGSFVTETLLRRE